MRWLDVWRMSIWKSQKGVRFIGWFRRSWVWGVGTSKRSEECSQAEKDDQTGSQTKLPHDAKPSKSLWMKIHATH